MYLDKRGAETYRLSIVCKGKRYTRTFHGPYDECLKQAVDYRIALIGGKLPTKAKLTILEAADRMYESTWHANKDGKRNVRRIRIIAEIIGNVPIVDIQTFTVERITRELSRARGPASVNRYLATLRSLLNHADLFWQEIKQVPRFRMLKEPEGRTREIVLEEEEWLLNTRSKAAFIVLLDTGIRLGELLSLSYGDIDAVDGSITIKAHNAKSGKKRRIPLTERALEYIYEAMESTETSIRTSWEHVRRVKHVKDPEFVIHACRHTCATRLVRNGVPLTVVKEILGHSSVKVTEKYAHVNNTDLVRAIRTL